MDFIHLSQQKRPIEGVEKDGVGGFFTGVGKGLVGYAYRVIMLFISQYATY
jgi:hypothetical protein